MRTPKFWLQNNFISFFLKPLTIFYKIGFELKKFFTTKHQIKIPIICIGNIIAGGAGKTPTALALGKYLLQQNINFCYLTRGYKSNNSGVKLLKKSQDSSLLDVGDEAILLSEIADTYIAKNRFLAYQKIFQTSQYQLIIMDDGLQNYQLNYAYKILVIDGKIGFGNECLMPSGPMRQTLKSIINDIDLFLIVNADEKQISSKIISLKESAKITKGKIICHNLDKFLNQNIISFCGIAYPQKFFDYCQKIGLRIIENHAFGDHHLYQDFELQNLLKIALKKNCKLITTKKDWVKFAPQFQSQIDYLDIELEFENQDFLQEISQKIINK